MDTNVTENFVMPEGVKVEEETTPTKEKKVVAALSGGDEKEVTTTFMEVKPTVKRPAFAYWEVGGNKYRLKLKTAGIQALEQKYKQNLMSFLETMPALSLMLEVVHEAMRPWHQGVTIKHVQALYDKYTDDGGDLMSFWKSIFIEVYKASGFFTQEMLQRLAEANEQK